MSDLKLLGLRVSVYTRIARLALAEKNIAYQFDEVDIFADSGPPADYLALNPFGTIPCLRHGEFVLYETPEGAEMLESFPRLQQWLREMQNRDSVRRTAFHDNG